LLRFAVLPLLSPVTRSLVSAPMPWNPPEPLTRTSPTPR
jgi:hypothetical protein